VNLDLLSLLYCPFGRPLTGNDPPILILYVRFLSRPNPALFSLPARSSPSLGLGVLREFRFHSSTWMDSDCAHHRALFFAFSSFPAVSWPLFFCDESFSLSPPRFLEHLCNPAPGSPGPPSSLSVHETPQRSSYITLYFFSSLCSPAV